jgi:hypothetical protein
VIVAISTSTRNDAGWPLAMADIARSSSAPDQPTA